MDRTENVINKYGHSQAMRPERYRRPDRCLSSSGLSKKGQHMMHRAAIRSCWHPRTVVFRNLELIAVPEMA